LKESLHLLNSNMLIWCSRNIHYYYYLLLQLCCSIFCGNCDTFLFDYFRKTALV